MQNKTNFLFIFSKNLILVLYGTQYFESIQIFQIHLFSNIFAFIGGATHQWYLASGYSKLTFHRVLGGAMLNVILNSILIPIYGNKGAAIATLISYFYVGIIAMYFNKKSRENFFLFINSLVYPFIYITSIRSQK